MQLAIAQADVMDQSEEVLAVVVFQLGKVVVGDQVVGQLVVTAGKTELIDPLGTAGNGQPFVIGRGATAGPLDLAQIQGQALDVPGGQLTATECLRQQAAVVEGQHRQFGLQGTEAQFGFADTGLAGEVDAAEIADRAAVVLQREEGTRVAVTVGLGGAAARIQADTNLAQGVRTCGITGLEVEQEALAPRRALRGGGGATAIVLVEVEVAGAEGGTGTLDESLTGLGQGGQGGQQSEGDGAGQQSVLHDVLRLFIRVVMGVSSGSAWSSGALTVGIK